MDEAFTLSDRVVIGSQEADVLTADGRRCTGPFLFTVSAYCSPLGSDAVDAAHTDVELLRRSVARGWFYVDNPWSWADPSPCMIATAFEKRCGPVVLPNGTADWYPGFISTMLGPQNGRLPPLLIYRCRRGISPLKWSNLPVQSRR